ncbi:MAG TPA: allantoinase AllB [Stenomitos sp.]
MPDTDLFLSSRRVITPEGERPATVLVRAGRIHAILDPYGAPPEVPVVDLGDLVLMPGVVDTHVHVNEPGRTEWEGFETATRAAAVGGITTLVDMPLNSMPVTTTLQAFEIKRAAAQGKAWIDYGFWGGVVPGNAAQLEPMIEAGLMGFKAFLCHSGIDDFPNVSVEDLRESMPILARHGVPLLVHAELPVHPAPEEGDPRRYATYLASRPASWEVAAVRQMIALCREYGTPVHIVHLSAADALTELAAAKREGLPITVETCPHYLVFAAEEIPDGATHFKCAPPIREAANRERLWQGLMDGTIDFVACDHSPCTPDLKLMNEGDFMRAWGGVSSLQFSLPVVWTHARERGIALERVVHWLCGRTAVFAGLGGRKGAIAPGYDADLVVWNPEAPCVIEPGMIEHRHKVTPYAGRRLLGRVEATYLRGTKIVERGQFLGAPRGEALVRRAAAREMV